MNVVTVLDDFENFLASAISFGRRRGRRYELDTCLYTARRWLNEVSAAAKEARAAAGGKLDAVIDEVFDDVFHPLELALDDAFERDDGVWVPLSASHLWTMVERLRRATATLRRLAGEGA